MHNTIKFLFVPSFSFINWLPKKRDMHQCCADSTPGLKSITVNKRKLNNKHTQRTQEFTWFGKLPTSTETTEKFHYKKQGDTIVHKNTFMKPKSQYTLTLSLTHKTRKLYSSSYAAAAHQVNWNYSNSLSYVLAFNTNLIYIYIYIYILQVGYTRNYIPR